MSANATPEVSTTGSGDEDNDEVCCNACGFEASFVPEGMIPCERCGEAQYCSLECLKWDWKSGGHCKTCVDKRPVEESSSEGIEQDILITGGSATPDDLISVGDATMMSMDIAHVFGFAPGSFDSRSTQASSFSKGVSPSRSSLSSGSPSSARRAGGTTTASSSSTATTTKKDVTPKAGESLADKKNFWETKNKQDATTRNNSNNNNNNRSATSESAHTIPDSPRSAASGGTSKLAAFFESQSKPVPLSPSKKNKAAPEGAIVTSFSGAKKTLVDTRKNRKKGQKKTEGDNDSGSGGSGGSMEEEDFKYAMGNHVVDNPLDESFDFMDKSVQTNGLKSIVEEDSSVSEEPDLEGSWRSRDPFGLDLVPESTENSSPASAASRNPTTISADSQSRLKSMLGQDDSENNSGNEDDDNHNERQNFWDVNRRKSHRKQQSSHPKHAQEDEEEESFEEEILEEDEILDEEEMEAEDEEEYEEEFEDEELYEEDQDQEEYSTEQSGQSFVEEEVSASASDSAHSSGKRKLVSATEQVDSRNTKTVYERTPPITPYSKTNGLSPGSSHSEPPSSDFSGSGSQRKRRSLPGVSSSDSATSRGAASLLDFRQLYTPQESPRTDTAKLKEFREAYSGPQDDSISSDTPRGNGKFEKEKVNLLGNENASQSSLGSGTSGQSKKSVNLALKTSINKALRDFEKLYGPDAARAAVARLTQAVTEDSPAAQLPISTKPNGSDKPRRTQTRRSTLDTTPKTPSRNYSDLRPVDRTLSPSSWAMPTTMSVSSSSTEENSLRYLTSHRPQASRSHSMPSTSSPEFRLKREASGSSWGLTGMSVASGAHTTSEGSALNTPGPAEMAAAAPHVETVPEGSVELSVQSGQEASETEQSTHSESERSSRSPWNLGLSNLGLGWGRKGNGKNDSKDTERGLGGVSSSNHTQQSNMASSWAFGFGTSSVRPEDDYQTARENENGETVSWLADLAKSSYNGEENVNVRGAVKDLDQKSDEEESIGNPFETDQSDEYESVVEPSQNQEKENTNSGEEESMGDPFPTEDAEEQSVNEMHEKEDPAGEANFSPTPEKSEQANPKYMHYRQILAKKNFVKDTARKLEFENNSDPTDKRVEEPSLGATTNSYPSQKSSVPRYMKYRSRLATKVSTEDPLSTIIPEEKEAERDSEGIRINAAADARVGALINGKTSRLHQYRSSLAQSVKSTTRTDEITPSKRPRESGVLLPPTSADKVPRYQKYRSHLATKISSVGTENYHNKFLTAMSSSESVKESGAVPVLSIVDASQLGDTITEDKSLFSLSESLKQNEIDAVVSSVNSSQLGAVAAEEKASPRYQKYRSSLAKNAPLSPAATPGNLPFSMDTRSEVQNGGNARGLTETKSSGTSGGHAGVPRYTKYRTSLADRVSVVSSTATDLSGQTPASVKTEMVRPDATLAADHEDDQFEEQLSRFLQKSEKGKTQSSDKNDLRSSWGDFNRDTSAEEEEATAGLRDLQSIKIATALAASNLFLGRQKGPPQPKESRLLDSSEQEKSASQSRSSGKSERLNSYQSVNVKCGPTDSLEPHADVEKGNAMRQKGMSPTESEAELGRNLYFRNQCYAYGLLICLLVAMPLGIALGIGLTRDEERDFPVPLGEIPSSSPSVSPLSPTLQPSPSPTQKVFQTVSPTGVTVLTSVPTGSPTFRRLGSPTSSPTAALSMGETSMSPTSIEASESPFTALPTTTVTMGPTAVVISTDMPTFVDEELFALLSSVSLDNGESIQAFGSPQNEAYTWLGETENLPSLSNERRIQRFALATLYFSTEGPNWSQSNGWLTTENECDWFSTGSGESTCDTNGAIVTLDLGFNGLMGSLPAELGLLTRLTRIDLSGGIGPGITGILPPQLSLLTSLEIFLVHDNAISGTLFSEIGSLGNLRILNLNSNDMTGQLPNEIGRLLQLSFMDLSSNNFSGPIPATIGNLVNLATLNIGNNGFTTIPASIGGLASLGSFKAPFNNLEGPLFDNWENLVNLEDLDLQSNSLTGPLPSSLGELGGLLVLDFSSNQFSSSIPTSFGGLTTLLILRLNSNQLTGNVPAAFANLQDVTELRIDDNNLVGSVPGQLCSSFLSTSPKFYLDCAAPEVTCPPGLCCTYCCTDGIGCECVFAGTPSDYLC